MSVIWYKVWFDLWHNKLRTLLVVLSIAVGVFAVGTTFGMLEQMLPNMDVAHRASLPSHATIYLTQPLDRETIIVLKKIPGIEDIEPSNTIEIRWKIRQDEEWRKGNILMRDDYENQMEDVVQLRQGAWPEGKSLSVERMHGPFYGVDIGDQVILEVDGQGKWFPITGLIRHPFVPPPSMYDVAWFFASEEIMERYGIPPGRFTEIKFRVSPYSPEHARAVASEVKERLARQGIMVRATMYQDPNKHWGRIYVDGMAVVLRVMAILSLVLSIILVLNTLTALITQQTKQIGILKAIGGTTYSVTKVYLAAVFFYGLLALCITLPLGSVTSFRLAHWFLGMYNIDYEDFSYSPTIIVLQVFAAIVVPLLAALIPVLKGATITVREAIASYGLGMGFSSSWVDRAVERIGQRFLISYYADALANTFRRKGRLVLTQLVLVTAGVMFLMVMGLSSSIDATLDAEFDRRSYDVTFNFDRLQRVDRTIAMANAVEGVEKAEMWLVEPVTILHEGQRARDAGLGSQIQGVPLEDPMYIPKIVDGRWLQPGDNRVIVMNKETAEDEHINLGDTVTLDLGEWGKDDWEVVGFYRAYLIFSGDYSVNAIYAPRQAVYEATKKTGKAATLMVRTQRHDVEQVNMVTARLKDLFEKEHIKIIQSETMTELRRISNTSFSMVVYMLFVLAVIIALVGGIGLMGSLWISVIERTKEIGILRSIGAVSFIILSMFTLESVIQSVLSWIIAVPVSLAITPFMANSLGQTMLKSRLEYQYNYEAALIWLLIVVVIAILASIIPARNAARINVRESLSYE